jgi:glycosyltransferase involved in cell wall biosynthesis
MELGVMSKWHPFIMVMQLAEDFACRFSDKVVSLLPKADLHLRTRGMAPEKFSYAPNGIAVSELTESSESQRPNLSSKALEIVEVVNLARARGDFIVGYAGGHGPSNALGTLLESAFLLRNEPFSFVLVGDGVDKATLQEETKRRGLSKVYFQAAVPKSDIMGVLGLFDCLYCGFQKLPLYRFGVSPNKLMDYLMAAKPVVTSLDAPNDVVAEARSGFSVPAENSPAVAAAIRNLKDTPPTERTQMANRGREYVLANFSYQHIAHRFLDGVLAP